MAVVDAAPEPVLAPGPPGRFDAQGVFAASAVRDGDRVVLYTVGWTVGTPPPVFYAAVGRAVSTDGGRTFPDRTPAPVLDRSEHDPCFVSAPTVRLEDGRWRMWYLSGVAWDAARGGLWSRYDVKYAESADGLAWRRDGRICLAHAVPEERNIARAWVLREGGRHRAWYSADRGEGYRMGYAESPDGLSWDRRDDLVDLPPSGAGWDAGAVAYPCVIRDGDRLVCLYNGDGFGRDGIGAAVWQDPAA
jgi:hypothetical protein